MSEGTPDVNTERRISRLETAFETIHRDSAETKREIGILTERTREAFTTLEHISRKLDKNSRPDLTVLAAVTSVLIIVMGISFNSVDNRLDFAQLRQDNADLVRNELSIGFSDNKARIVALEKYFDKESDRIYYRLERLEDKAEHIK